MPWMTDKTLELTTDSTNLSMTGFFLIHTQQALNHFARHLESLVRQLYEKRCIVHGDSSTIKCMLVTIDGELASGKSTLSMQLLSKLSIDFDGSDGVQIELDNPKRTALAWATTWNSKTQSENRVFDCLVVGPYRSIHAIETDPPCPELPRRRWSGIDVIEHSFDVPNYLVGLKVFISVVQEQTRLVTVCLPEANRTEQYQFNKFRECAEKEALCLEAVRV